MEEITAKCGCSVPIRVSSNFAAKHTPMERRGQWRLMKCRNLSGYGPTYIARAAAVLQWPSCEIAG